MERGQGLSSFPAADDDDDDDPITAFDGVEEDALIPNGSSRRSARPPHSKTPSSLYAWRPYLLIALAVLTLQVFLNGSTTVFQSPLSPCPLPAVPNLVSASAALPPSISPLAPVPPTFTCDASKEPLPTTPPSDAPFYRWAADGAPLSLTCPSDLALHIRAATFGDLCGWHPATGLGAVCPWTSALPEPLPLTPALPSTCRIAYLTPGLQSLCAGRPSCLIERAHIDSLDLCSGHDLRLVVAYTCEPHPRPQAALTLPSLDEAHARALSDGGARDPPQPPVPPPRHCELVVSSQVNITGFGPWMGGGLWNQLVNTQQMAVLAWALGCNLSVTAFLPDYNAPLEVRFGRVFDLPAMNRALCGQHQAALGHPTTSFFQGATMQGLAQPPLVVSDSVMRDGWPGWEGMVGGYMDSLLAMTIRAHRHLSMYFDVVARAVQAHPDPGSLWMRGGWGGWAGAEDTLPGLGYLRGLFVASIRFTAPFEDSVQALQQLMGVSSSGRFSFVHFRLEEDLIIFARGAQMTLEEFSDRMFEQLMKAVDSMASLDHPKGSEALAMAQRIRAWPIYLGTGVLYSNPYVTRMKKRYPWATVYTKDVFLAQHCGVPVPEGVPKAVEGEWGGKLVEALKRLPWTEGIDECTWLRTAVKGESRWHNREYWAVLDWMLTREVSHFVGPTKSSFTVNAVAAIQHKPKTFHDGTPGGSDAYTQFALGLPVEF